MEKEKGKVGMKFGWNLTRIYPWFAYLVFIVATIIMMLYPIGIPFGVTDEVKRVYQLVQNIPSGSVVLLVTDFDSSRMTEIGYPMISLANHMMARGLKLITATIHRDGASTWVNLCGPYLKFPANTKYGVDYVWFAMTPGEEAGMAALRSDFWAATGVDYYGTPVAQIPLMQKVHRGEDFAFSAVGSSDATGPVKWLRQWGASFPIPMIVVVHLGGVPTVMPYVGISGGFISILKAMHASAEYDLLTQIKGPAIATMDTLSMGAIVVMGFVVVANIGLVIERRRK